MTIITISAAIPQIEQMRQRPELYDQKWILCTDSSDKSYQQVKVAVTCTKFLHV